MGLLKISLLNNSVDLKLLARGSHCLAQLKYVEVEFLYCKQTKLFLLGNNYEIVK